MIKYPEVLNQLCKCFNGEKLYIVGGCVRDSLSGNFKTNDIDLCGGFCPENFEKNLQKNGFELIQKNQKFGVYFIRKEKFSCEFARFRTEKYKNAGEHSPSSVEFISDIKQDAKRRDFTINAIYYSINDNKIVDYYNGVDDIAKQIIRTIETPEFVFENDAVRIFRMVKYSCLYGYNIEKSTFDAARQNVSKIELLSDNMRRNEINKLFDIVKKFSGIIQKLKIKRKIIKMLNVLNIKY